MCILITHMKRMAVYTHNMQQWTLLQKNHVNFIFSTVYAYTYICIDERFSNSARAFCYSESMSIQTDIQSVFKPQLEPALAGNLASLLVSPFVCVAISLLSPQVCLHYVCVIMYMRARTHAHLSCLISSVNREVIQNRT